MVYTTPKPMFPSIKSFIDHPPSITLNQIRETHLGLLLPQALQLEVSDDDSLKEAEILAGELSQAWLENFCEQEMLRSHLMTKIAQVEAHFNPLCRPFVVRRLCEVAKATHYHLKVQAQCLLDAEFSLRDKITDFCEQKWKTVDQELLSNQK